MISKNLLLDYIKSKIRSLENTIKHLDEESHNYIRYNGKLDILKDLLYSVTKEELK